MSYSRVRLYEFCKRLGIDPDAKPADFSDPKVIRRLQESFTEHCLLELEAGDRAELFSRVGAVTFPVGP